MKQENNVKRKSKQFAENIRKDLRRSIISKKRAEILESTKNQQQDIILGQQLFQKQKSILTQSNFLKVFTKKQLQELKIDWSIFQQGDFDFPPAKIQAIESIENFIRGYLYCNKPNCQSKLFKNLRYDVLGLNHRKQYVENLRIQKYTQLYFSNIMSYCHFAFSIKQQGIHLGTKITFYNSQFNQHSATTYYVKTHTHGLTQDKNFPDIVNLNELVVYKILQKIGIGCEAHFYGKDIRNFYIAIKDAGHSDTFLTYDKMKKNPQCQEFFRSQNFSKDIIYLDLLCYILRLTDIHENHKNFGFVKTSHHGWSLRVIDFIVPLRKEKSSYQISSSYFQNFIKGYTQYRSFDKILNNVFKKEQSILESVGKQIFLSKLRNFHKIVEESQYEVLRAIQQNIGEKINEQVFQRLSNELKNYTMSLKHNYDVFSDQFNITSLEIQDIMRDLLVFDKICI